ncbi:MAG TPA: glycerophosphodiester phosphodiesterase family protein [Anaerolineae bacterium]|nr:glycerophosphodiester phosphodiesterase family protein [Anaerolineae bacterium]HQI83778.1 glycerophosphodiester phosphodiesterase family protein [Anaerolineae bacterium]
MTTRFPDLWQREQPLGRPFVLGHRGASHAAPQNTLAAFREAAAVGADGIELDVHLSRDGVPVVIHNDTVDATTDGKGLVCELTLAQLKALDAGGRFDARFTGERIPTLEEVLAEVGARLLINIELKAGHTAALAPAVVDLVKRMGMTTRVWFSSFKPYALYRARALAPEIPCGLLYGPLNPGTLLLRPFTPHEALHPYKDMLTARSIRRAHQRGLRVFTWTLDDPVAARRLAAWGIDGIITNEPALILEALRKT